MNCPHKWSEHTPGKPPRQMECEARSACHICQHCNPHCPGHLGLREHILRPTDFALSRRRL